MSETGQRTPLYVIGGSLGSGKTTLLRRLLTGEHGRLGVIVNEFGELGIDGRLIEGRDIEMVELTGGCVCCSLAGEFAAGVRELIEKTSPEAVLVETTGVAEADALLEDIETDLPEVRLEALVVLIDADTAGRFPALGYVERNQLAAADLVLINKTDLAERRAIDELRARIASINPETRLLETVQAGIGPALVLADPLRASASKATREDRASGARPRGAREQAAHGHEMESFVWRPGAGSAQRNAERLERTAFERAVANWPREVYRAKGWIRLDGQGMLLNYVAGRWQLEPCAGPRGGRPGNAEEPGVVFIGPDLARHREAIVASLEACRG